MFAFPDLSFLLCVLLPTLCPSFNLSIPCFLPSLQVFEACHPTNIAIKFIVSISYFTVKLILEKSGSWFFVFIFKLCGFVCCRSVFPCPGDHVGRHPLPWRAQRDHTEPVVRWIQHVAGAALSVSKHPQKPTTGAFKKYIYIWNKLICKSGVS